MPFKVIAFDFDGVILESAAIKTEAMATLFADHPEHRDAIVAIHERNAGISRYIKFDMIYRDLLKASLSSETRAALGQRFSELVVEKVLACPFVPGTEAFLESRRGTVPMFVVSGTPDDELAMIVERRGLSPFFDAVHGSNATKPDVLRRILAERACRSDDLVFIGDGRSDFEAARATGVAFLGRVADGHDNPFPESTPTVPDLQDLEPALARLAR